MSAPHVVVMNLQATGHVNPTLALVAELCSRGCKVTYFVDVLLKETVEGAGAAWRPYRYPHGNFTGIMHTLDEVGISKYVPEGTPETEYQPLPMAMIYNAEMVLPALLQDLQNLYPRPSLIVYDPFIAFARVAAHVLQVPAVCSLTIPGPGVLPKPEATIQAWEAKPWVEGPRKHILEQYGFDVFKDGLQQEFYSPTLNIVTTIDELFAPPAAGLQTQRYGDFPFKCVGPLVDFTVKRVAHVGTLATAQTMEEGGLLMKIDEAIAAGRKVILLSMGTVATSTNKWNSPLGAMAKSNGLDECTGKMIVQHVFRTCFEALGKDERIIVVLATGGQKDALEGLPATPSNFIVRQSVPQLEILKRSSAFITHGGANSMHESILLKVPMAVVPLFGDQPANATSIARCGAGVAFLRPLNSLSPESLQSAVDQLLEHESFQEEVARVSAKFVASGGAPVAADAILELACATGAAKAGA